MHTQSIKIRYQSSKEQVAGQGGLRNMILEKNLKFIRNKEVGNKLLHNSVDKVRYAKILVLLK